MVAIKNDGDCNLQSISGFAGVYSFNAENAAPSSADIIQYITGAPSIPVLESFDKIPVKFLHGCKPSENGTPYKCFPTCDIFICLPVHIATEENMTEAITRAIKEGFGFYKI